MTGCSGVRQPLGQLQRAIRPAATRTLHPAAARRRCASRWQPFRRGGSETPLSDESAGVRGGRPLSFTNERITCGEQSVVAKRGLSVTLYGAHLRYAPASPFAGVATGLLRGVASARLSRASLR